MLSSPAVDPATLAPKGTILNAEKADDSRGKVRVPFTQIAKTALEVIDFENEGSRCELHSIAVDSGAG